MTHFTPLTQKIVINHCFLGYLCKINTAQVAKTAMVLTLVLLQCLDNYIQLERNCVAGIDMQQAPSLEMITVSYNASIRLLI